MPSCQAKESPIGPVGRSFRGWRQASSAPLRRPVWNLSPDPVQTRRTTADTSPPVVAHATDLDDRSPAKAAPPVSSVAYPTGPLRRKWRMTH